VSNNCGVRTNGTITCWGTQNIPSGTFIQISNSCGVKTDGSVACWSSSLQQTLPKGTFTQVAAGIGHACGVKTDSSVVCWGDDRQGQSTPPSTVSNCTHALFSPSDGVLTIPMLDVPNGFGDVTTYRTKMSQMDGEGLVFSVTNAEPIQ
jgi:hypothetical protein